MRTAALVAATMSLGTACASTATTGTIGEGSNLRPRITAVDTARPPTTASVELDQPAYAAVVLVAPGFSATLLYPSDSTTDNRLAAGHHQLPLNISELITARDTGRARSRVMRRPQSVGEARARTGGPGTLPPNATTYLLLVTSPQELSYSRMYEKTAGVSIPLDDVEALSAVGKAIKSTIVNEPREWAGHYHLIDISNTR